MWPHQKEATWPPACPGWTSDGVVVLALSGHDWRTDDPMQYGNRMLDYAWDLHYESAALTAELRARMLIINQRQPSEVVQRRLPPFRRRHIFQRVDEWLIGDLIEDVIVLADRSPVVSGTSALRRILGIR